MPWKKQRDQLEKNSKYMNKQSNKYYFLKHNQSILVVLLLIILAILLPLCASMYLGPHKKSSLLNASILLWTILAIAGYSYILYIQKNIQQEDLEVSKKILEQSQTPYVEVRLNYKSPSKINPSIINIEFEARNIGNSIAKDIQLTALEPQNEPKVRLSFKSVGFLPADKKWVKLDLEEPLSYAALDYEDKLLFWYGLKKNKPNIAISYSNINSNVTYKSHVEYDDKYSGFLKELKLDTKYSKPT